MNKKRVIAAGGAAAVSLIMALPAFAATTEQNTTTSPSYHSTQNHAHKKTGSSSSEGSEHKLTNADFGTVTSVDGSSFTLQRKTGTGTSTVTIDTDSTTVFKENGKTGADFANLEVGQRVVAMGVKDSSGNIADATSVNIMVRKARTATAP